LDTTGLSNYFNATHSSLSPSNRLWQIYSSVSEVMPGY